MNLNNLQLKKTDKYSMHSSEAMGIQVGQFLRGKGSGERGDVLVTNKKIQGSTLKSLKYLENQKLPKKLKIFGLQGKKQCKGKYKMT